MFNIKQILSVTFLLAWAISWSQRYDKKISSSQLILPDQTVHGFSMTFDFAPSQVEKEWWKYAKKFAIPRNQRTHYEITIPSTNDSREVIIFTQVEGDDKPVKFKLGIPAAHLSGDQKNKITTQAKTMLLDFKRWMYLRYYEEQIHELEKAISQKEKTWEDWMEFVREREKIIGQMRGI